LESPTRALQVVVVMRRAVHLVHVYSLTCFVVLLVPLFAAEQAADQRMREMQDRLDTTEQRQNTIVSFLARVAQNPAVLQQMVSAAQASGLQRIGNKKAGTSGRCIDIAACGRRIMALPSVLSSTAGSF
jgi:CHASE3 domain sensor protein